MIFLRIVAPHFVAGIVVGHRAAPIIGYMLTWDERQIRGYCQHKKWKIQRLDPKKPKARKS